MNLAGLKKSNRLRGSEGVGRGISLDTAGEEGNATKKRIFLAGNSLAQTQIVEQNYFNICKS